MIFIKVILFKHRLEIFQSKSNPTTNYFPSLSLIENNGIKNRRTYQFDSSY